MFGRQHRAGTAQGMATSLLTALGIHGHFGGKLQRLLNPTPKEPRVLTAADHERIEAARARRMRRAPRRIRDAAPRHA